MIDIIQSVTHEADGVLRIRLTIPPGAAPPAVPADGGAFKLPAPVQVMKSDVVVVDIGWLSGPARQETSQPMRMPAAATLTHLYVGPSALRPGTTQLAVSEGEPATVPDLFFSRLWC